MAVVVSRCPGSGRKGGKLQTVKCNVCDTWQRYILDSGIVEHEWTRDMPLNEIMDFDSVVEVKDNGQIVYRPDEYAPELLDEQIDSDEWEFFSTGYTGQHGYRGPIMHNSEFIGGRLESDILSTPGVYVAVVASWTPGEEDDPDEGTILEGWAILRKKD